MGCKERATALVDGEEGAKFWLGTAPTYSPQHSNNNLKYSFQIIKLCCIPRLLHNHPSGSPQPSRADIQITQRVIEAARLLGIVVHDHVIVGREGHVSLKAKGLI